MNISWPQPVLTIVRALLVFPLLLLPLLLGSFSTSRLVDSDRVLDPGSHTIRSIIDSDILVPEGTSLHVDYIAGNRFFVQSGGTLSGLGKGAQRSTIYAEPGALVPALSQKSHIRTVEVKDAEQKFRDRFKTLLPADATSSPSGRTAVSGGVYFGGGYYRNRHHNYRARNHTPPSRSASVKPDSYRSRN